MRITFVLPSYPWRPGGGFRAVYEYANQLAGRGHEVFVVHPRQRCSFQPNASVGRYQRLRQRAAVVRDWFVRPRPDTRWQFIDPRVQLLYVPDLASRHLPDADAVFATWWETAERVLDLPDRKGDRFYLIQHFETWGGPRERVEATWRAPLHKAVISSWLYSVGVKMGCRDIANIGYGTDHTRFVVLAPIPERRKKVAMMFSPIEWKGGDDGIAALGEVKAVHEDLEAVLFGVGPRPSSLPAWIEYRRNPSQKELVCDVYNAASIYLCPSWTEGFALPPAEAMACGCAVVSTECGGILDYAKPEVTALLSRPRDPKSLATNLLRVLEDENLRIRIATEGHQQIRSLTWERSADRLEWFMRECMATPQRKEGFGSDCWGRGVTGEACDEADGN